MRRSSLATALLLLVQTDASCADLDDGAKDTDNYGCSGYTTSPIWCGNYDDADFTSNTMCCACDGGSFAFATKATLQTAVQLWVNDQDAALSTYGHISGWGVSAITNMAQLFKDLQTFDEDISSWDTSSVTDMRYMFRVRPLRMPCPQCPVGSSVHVACTVTTPTRPRASRPARRRP